LDALIGSVAKFSPDFISEREQPAMQSWECLD
jgi:hypothetical protein